MKKLLVLMLVLGMASLASASLELSFNGVTGASFDLATDDSASIGVYNNVEEQGAGATVYLSVVTTDGWWVSGSGATYQPPIPDGAGPSTTYYGVTNVGAGFKDYYEIVSSVGTTADFLVGVLGDITLSRGTGTDTLTVQMWNQAMSSVIDTMTIGVPEPATMLLLGLGGFFLRRRK